VSGNASRRRGRSRELAYRDQLRAEGWWCERVDTPGVDLVAAKQGERLHFIQVKSTARGPYATFGRAYRAVMLEEAKAAGAVCALVWWPKNGKPKWYDETSWP
jgi:hypothetical protein